MNFKDIHLSKFEYKILKVLNRYNQANAYELRGYFHFIGINKILLSVQHLQKEKLVFYEEVKSSYVINPTGEKYVFWHRKRTFKNLFLFITSLAGLIVSLKELLNF